MSLASQHLFRLGFRRALPSSSSSVARVPISYRSRSIVKPGFEFGRRRCKLPRHFPLSVAAIDESSTNITELLEESNGSCGGNSPSANEGKGSSTYLCGTPDAAITVPVDQFASQKLARGRRRRRIAPGILINAGLITFASLFLLFFEWYSWQIVRLPLETFYLTRPFVISTILSACAGWLYVPIVDKMKIHQILRKEGPKTHYSKKGTPTMGGLFFVPIGVAVAQLIVGRSSFPVYAAAVATLAFAAIGLLDDLLSCVKGHNYGLSGWMKFSLQAAVGAWFSIWLDSTSITTPYHMYSFFKPIR